MRSLALLLCGAILSAASPIDAPRLGWMRSADGQMRTVWGIAGTAILGEAQRPVDQLAASNSLVIACSNQTLTAYNLSGDAIGTASIDDPILAIGFDSTGARAAALTKSAVWIWDKTWHPTDLPDLNGTVLAVAMRLKTTLALISRSSGGVWLVEISAGRIASERRIDASEVAAMQPDGTVIWADGLILSRRAPSGITDLTELPAPLRSLTPFSKDRWTGMDENGTAWLIQSNGGPLSITQLPAAEPTPVDETPSQAAEPKGAAQ